MTFIIIGIIIIYLLVIAWSWNSLEDTETPKKLLIIFAGIVAVFLITQIVFSMSKSGVNYENNDIEKSVGQVIVLLFTGVNSLVIPFITRTFKKKENGEIEDNVFKVRMIIICVIFLICLFLECGYMTDTQEGILRVYQSNMR